MNKNKRIVVFSFLGIVLFLAGGYITLDWVLFYLGHFDHAKPVLLFSRSMKLSVSFMLALLVFIAGDDAVDDRDFLRIRLAFLFIVCGDIVFYLDLNTAGVAAFALGQTFLIIRNGHGIKEYFSGGAYKKDLPWMAAALGIISVINVFLFIFVFYPILAGTSDLYIILAYSVFISLALWIGWFSLKIGYFPKFNAICIALAMTLFYLGDIIVGLNTFLKPGFTKTVASYLSWMLYTPTLIFLFISSYKKKRLFPNL